MRGRNAAFSWASVGAPGSGRRERCRTRRPALRVPSVFARVLPAHRARAFVEQLALGVGDREQRAELAVGERIADQQRAARIHVFGDVVVAALHAGDDGEAVVVERPRGAQVDGRAERAFLDSAAEVLRTVIELNSSEAKMLKSNERSRLVPPAASVPPLALIASMPLMRTRVNCGPRPRTVICRPSPASRAIDTPGTRWMDSARFRSGKSAMSSATIASTTPVAARFSIERDAQALAKAGDDDFFERFLRRRGSPARKRRAEDCRARRPRQGLPAPSRGAGCDCDLTACE